MAVWSEVFSSQIDAKSRIDSEYFSPEYIRAESLLDKVYTKKLPELFLVSDGNHLEVSKYFSDDPNSVPYYRGKDITNFFIENATPKRIPEAIYNSRMMKRSHFISGDVLLSIVGTIGSLSIVPEGLGDATGSCKIAILRKRETQSPYYSAAFLLSKYGQSQIKRNTRGAVQMGLILKDFIRIRIPVFSTDIENKIEKLVIESIEKNKLSKSLYNKAQNLLERELGLDQSVLEKPKSYEANFSELVTNGRFDAQCYKPDYINYEMHLRRRGDFDYLGNVIISTIKGQQAKVAGGGNLEYVSIKDIKGLEIYSMEKCIESSNIRVAQKNDLLLAITGATIGKIGIVSRSNRLAFSGDLLSLRTKDNIDPYYLLAVMSNRIGQSQCQRWITGSTNGHLSPTDVKKIVIPRISTDAEKVISQLLQSCIRASLDSEELLEQAKKEVESLIEGAVQK